MYTTRYTTGGLPGCMGNRVGEGKTGDGRVSTAPWRGSEDHKLSSGQKEPVAQLYGAEVGPWQAQGVEPEGLLAAYESADRVCAVFDCAHYEHLSIPENAA